jgi:hypothetical protein
MKDVTPIRKTIRLFTMHILVLAFIALNVPTIQAAIRSVNVEPVAIVTDSLGNTYVTGWSFGGTTGFDIVTQKYSSTGSLLWSARYSTPGEDIPYAIALDSGNHVYVAGQANGKSLVVRYSSGCPSRLDTTFPVQCSFEVARQDWAREVIFDTYIPNSDSHAAAIAVGSGIIYVTGTVNDQSNPEQITVAISATSGNILWNDGPYQGSRAQAIGLSDTGQIFVASNAIWTQQFFLTRFELTGAYSTSRSVYFANAQVGDLQIRGTSVYAAGRFIAGSSDCFVVKYNLDLVEQWRKTMSCSPSEPKIAIDSAENLYVGVPNRVYRFAANGNGSGGAALTAYWDFSNTEIAGIAIDHLDEIYITGTVANAGGTGKDIVTAKLATPNTLVRGAYPLDWVQQYASSGAFDDVAKSLAVHYNGSVSVIGTTYGGLITLKYSSTGALLW